MKDKTKQDIKKQIVTAFMAAMIFLVGCAHSSGEGFAIYMTKDDIPPSRMEAQSHLILAEQPFISLDDIVSYDARTHICTLTSEAYERISELKVPIDGKSFLVCVDNEPLYWGAFWTGYSSLSFDGVTIWQPLGDKEANAITITLGYPSFSFFRGEDPRNNPKAIQSLERAGKLVVGD